MVQAQGVSMLVATYCDPRSQGPFNKTRTLKRVRRAPLRAGEDTVRYLNQGFEPATSLYPESNDFTAWPHI